MTQVLSVEDRLDIESTIARYAHILNNLDLDALDLVFTPDAILHSIGGGEPRNGLTEIRAALTARPIADHMTTNVYVEPFENEVRVWSMFLVVTDDHKTLNGDYLDVVVQTDVGWRIAHRTVIGRNRGHGEEGHTEAYKEWLLSARRQHSR